MRKVIGLTGSIGTGKSTVAKKLTELGYRVIDCDKISHSMLYKNRKGYKQVIATFGESILDEDLRINRKKLGAIVFSDLNKRLQLNNILHPLIKEKVKSDIRKVDNGIVFLDCPLLFETDFKELCDETIVVYTDMNTQIRRIMERDKTDFPTTIKRIYSQMPLDEKLVLSDYVIDNCHQIGDLNWQIKVVIGKIKEKM